MHAHLSPSQKGEIKDRGRGGKQGWEAAVAGTVFNNQWLGLRFPSLRTLSDVERDGKAALWQGFGSWSCGPVQILCTGDVPAQCPNPRACRCSWLCLQTFLQRERGAGAGSSHQKERLRGKLQKGECPKPWRRLCVHKSLLQEGRERSGRAWTRTDPLHCLRGHMLCSVEGLCRVKMPKHALKRPKRLSPGEAPVSATFPTRVFQSFLRFFINFF